LKAFNLIVFDIRGGVLAFWKRGVVVGGLFLLLNAALYQNAAFSELGIESLSLGDYFISTFAGINGFYYLDEKAFIVPVRWLAIILPILYYTLNYPYNHLPGIGKHVLVLLENRWNWWLTKCFWVFLSVLLYFLIGLVVTIVWVLLTNGTLTLDVSPGVPALLGFDPEILLQPPWATIEFIAITFLMILALCQLQMALALVIKPIF